MLAATQVAANMKQMNLKSSHKRPVIYLDQQLNQKRQVKLKTCADVYEYWRTCKRLYKKAPKDGVEFEIDYIDTGLLLEPEVRDGAPIALTLHGAPGSYHDFSLLIHHLVQEKVRVIAPNFPEYTATVKTKVLFRHSADEKAAYLRDFLKAINVNKIDLLVSHSSAIFPTLLILLNANNNNNNNNKQARMLDQPDEVRNFPKGTTINHSTATNTTAAQSNGDCGRVNNGDHYIMATSDNFQRQTTRLADEKQPPPLDTDLDPTAGSSSSSCYSEPDCSSSRASTPQTRFMTDLASANEQDNIDGNNNQTHIDQVTVEEHDHNGSRLGRLQEEVEEEEEVEQQTHQPPPTLESKSKLIRKSKWRLTRKGDKSESQVKRSQDVIVQFEQPIQIKAVALFNPAGHRLPKSMKPTWLKCGSVRIYQHKLGRSLFRKLGPAFLTVIGVPVRVDSMDNVMLSATVMRNSKCHRVVKQLEQLSEMKLPTLLVFSENDKLIEKEIFYEMTQHMNLDKAHFDIFNDDGDLELSQSSWHDWIRVMVFKAGGHYAYSNYAKTVNKAISELLEKVAKQS